MDSLSRVDLQTLLLLLLFQLCGSFDVSRLSHGPSVTDEASRLIHRQRGNVCKEVPPRILRQVLGSAYNEYYMSIDAPTNSIVSAHVDDTLYKRSKTKENQIISNHPFFVKENSTVTLSEEPAWSIDYSASDENSTSRIKLPETRKSEQVTTKFELTEHRRTKRSISDSILDAIALSGETNFRWHCDAPLRWVDLGSDYFPRYILSVDCSHHSCQGERFRCEPNSFAIKVLRRREGVCAPGFDTHEDTLEIGAEQMPYSLRELWVWEMRAVTFCCVCKSKW